MFLFSHENVKDLIYYSFLLPENVADGSFLDFLGEDIL